jgi:hypothetical protein
MRNITRRSAVNALVGVAGLSVIPVAASAIPDPIFAAIERHKALNAAFSHTLHLMGECEKEHGHADSPEHDEWHRREIETCDAEVDACDEMIATAPTTLAGLLALLRYVEQEHARGEKLLDQNGLEELLSATITALGAIGAVS